MDGDPREEGDSIVCSLDVLRRLGWMSLGGFKCGINVLECALWSRKVTSATPRIARFLGQKAQGQAYRRILHAKAFMTSSNLIFSQTLEIFKYFPDSLMSLSLVNRSA